jgi:hypothetical protein
VNVTNFAFQRCNRFPFRSFSFINNVINFTALKTINGFDFRILANGIGRSLPFSSATPEKKKKNKWKKKVKVVAH